MQLDTLTATVFRTLSRLRGARVFHPLGAAYEGTWTPGEQDLLGASASGSARAVVRVSRGIGLPRSLPDVLGVAIKVLDLHGPGHDQDLLLASVARGPLGTGVLTASRSFSGTRFSSLLPYDVGGRRSPVVATVVGEPSTTPEDAGDATGVEVRTSLRSGELLGTTALGRRLPLSVAEDLRFDPWHTGGTIRPAGVLNRFRRPAYRASQQGRSAPADGARDERLAG